MEYIEHPELVQLSAILTKINLGSTFLQGKIEAFSSKIPTVRRGSKSSKRKDSTENPLDLPLAPEDPQAEKGGDLYSGSYLQGNFLKIGKTETVPTNIKSLSESVAIDAKRIRSYSFGTELSSSVQFSKQLSNPITSTTSGSGTLVSNPTALINALNGLPPIKKPARKRTSSLGDLSEPSSRVLFMNLIAALNDTFPDYDFNHTKFEQFREENVTNVIKLVNNYLVEVTTQHPLFLDKLWSTLDELVTIRSCEVFAYIPDINDDDYHHNLWSFHYFFFNKSSHRLIYFCCSGRRLVLFYFCADF